MTAAEPAGTFAGAIDEITGVAAEGELPPVDVVMDDEEPPPPQPVKTKQKTTQKNIAAVRQRPAYLMRQGSLAGCFRGILRANVQKVTLSMTVRPVQKTLANTPLRFAGLVAAVNGEGVITRNGLVVEPGGQAGN